MLAAPKRRRASAIRSSSASTAFEPARLGLEGGQERPQRRRGLADADLGFAEVGRDLPQLGRERGHRLERTHRLPHSLRSARGLSPFGVERLGARGRGLGQLGHVAQPLAGGQESLLVAGLHSVRSGHELRKLLEPLRLPRRRAGYLFTGTARADQLPPGALKLPATAKLFLAHEGVEDVELVRRPGEAALLELARHGQEPLDESRQVLARHGPPPGVGAGAPVREDAAGGHQALLPRRPQLGDRLELRVVEKPVRKIELGLDIGLLGPGPEIGGIARSAEEKADRLRQDRLPGPRLAGDRVQARRERQVRLADEDEALDAEAAEHSATGTLRGSA